MAVSRTKIIRSALGIVFSNYHYTIIAIVAWFFLLGILVWLFTFTTLTYVLSLPDLSAADKLSFFFEPYKNSFLYFFRDPVTASRLIFTILAAVVVASYFYIRDMGGSYSKKKKLED